MFQEIDGLVGVDAADSVQASSTHDGSASDSDTAE